MRVLLRALLVAVLLLAPLASARPVLHPTSLVASSGATDFVTGQVEQAVYNVQCAIAGCDPPPCVTCEIQRVLP